MTQHHLACYSCKLQEGCSMACHGPHPPLQVPKASHLRRPRVFAPGDAPHRLRGEQADLSIRHRRPAGDESEAAGGGEYGSRLRVHKSQGMGMGMGRGRRRGRRSSSRGPRRRAIWPAPGRHPPADTQHPATPSHAQPRPATPSHAQPRPARHARPAGQPGGRAGGAPCCLLT